MLAERNLKAVHIIAKEYITAEEYNIAKEYNISRFAWCYTFQQNRLVCNDFEEFDMGLPAWFDMHMYLKCLEHGKPEEMIHVFIWKDILNFV